MDNGLISRGKFRILVRLEFWWEFPGIVVSRSVMSPNGDVPSSFPLL